MEFLRFIFTKRFLKHLLLATGIALVLIWLALKSLAWYTRHNDYLVVPDFRGLPYHQVVQDPAGADFRFVVIDSLYIPEKEKGSILSQDPFPGARVKANRMVYLTITSTVPEKTNMPELRDLTLRQAQSMLESAGLRAGRITYVRSFDEDAVQNQWFNGRPIRAGTEIEKGSRIDLTVGMGAKEGDTVSGEW